MDEGQVKSRMQEVLDLVASDIASVRSSTANPSVVSDISVTVYGGQQKLKVNELATVSATDTQTIIIDPWDKSIIGEIKKGIESANVGLTPSVDGEIIRINIPPMTKEDREKLVKLLGGKVESGRVMIRQARGEAIKDTRHAFEEKDLTEDEKFNQEKKLQEITDSFINKIEEKGEIKKKELLQL